MTVLILPPPLYEKHMIAQKKQGPPPPQWLRRGASLPRALNTPSGLLNDSMTCFLNSLIQTLYHSPLRPALYSQVPSPNPLISSLTTLFAKMQSSSRSSQSTKDLTSAFGWDNTSARSNQSDVQELQIILFDAINQPSLISSHFEFKSADNLEFTCPKCAHVNDRGTDATVTELILSISEFKDFRRALQSWESVESLNCDNTPGNLSGIECEGPGCSNRCAVKKFTCLKALPSFTFNIILQRLEFDMTTLTRKKVTTAFDIPTILEVKPGLSSTWDSPANNNSPTKFYLTSILLHSGTANGGHYYSMHRQIDNTWSKCNDSVVTNFTTEEFMKVLPSLSTLVYMMSFTEEKHLLTAPPAIPASLAAVIAADEVIVKEQAEFELVSQDVATLKIHTDFTAEVTTTTTMKTETLANVLKHTCEAHNIEYDLAKLRLRSYNPFQSGSVGETFHGREEETLEQLLIHPKRTTLKLEIRAQNDPPFVDSFDSDITVCVFQADDASDLKESFSYLSSGGVGCQPYTVRENANVADLLEQLPAPAPQHLFKLNGAALVHLKDNALALNGHWTNCGDVLLAFTDVDPEQVIAEYKRMESCIKIHYNTLNPTDPLKTVLVDKNSNVWDLVGEIKAGLNLTEPIHLRRSEKGPQLKNLTETVAKCGLRDEATVFVAAGEGLKNGEVLMKFVAKEKSATTNKITLTPLFEFGVNEAHTVLQLRAAVFEKWETNKPPSANHLRLQDKDGDQSLLRDSRKVKASLPRLFDNRQVIVTVLKEEEIIAEKDLIIQIKINIEGKVVPGGVQVCKRDWKIPDLAKVLFEKMGEKLNVGSHQELAVAKVAGQKIGAAAVSKLDFRTCGAESDLVTLFSVGFDPKSGGSCLHLRDNSLLVVKKIGEEVKEVEKVVAGGEAGTTVPIIAERAAVVVQVSQRKEKGIVIKKFEGTAEEKKEKEETEEKLKSPMRGQYATANRRQRKDENNLRTSSA